MSDEYVQDFIVEERAIQIFESEFLQPFVGETCEVTLTSINPYIYIVKNTSLVFSKKKTNVVLVFSFKQPFFILQ